MYKRQPLNNSQLTEVTGGDAPHYYWGYAIGLYWEGAKAAAKGIANAISEWKESNVEKYGTAGH